MRYQSIRLFSITILFIICLDGKSQTWPKFYGQPNKLNYSDDIEEAYDKGYLICGNIYSPGSNTTQSSWLIKTDVNGDTLWSKIIKNSQQFIRTLALEPTKDGGLLLAGLAYISQTESLPYIIKLNACGEKEWCRMFGNVLGIKPWVADVKETEAGEIILLVNQYGVIPQETLHLFKLNADGNALWKKPFVSGYIFPQGALPFGSSLHKTYESNYIISGDIYWEDPWNPGGIKAIRPLFCMVDSVGIEKWVLPFGLNDSIHGVGHNIMKNTVGNYIGVGSNWPSQIPYKEGLIMEFDHTGNEINYKIVNAKEIDTNYHRVIFFDSFVNDTLVIFGGVMGVEIEGNPTMETISNDEFFSNLIFYNNVQHSSFITPYALGKAGDKILSNSTLKQSGNWDIVLGKLNLNLEYDTAYPGVYTYDSLCTTPGLPQSGFIFLDDCDIITGMEIPSPEEYYASVQTIVVTAYPNPAETEITLAFQNTEHHNNMLLECYNLFGQRVHSEKVYKGQQKTKLSIEQWQSGLYIAVIKSDGRVAGKVRFVRR
ncbi:MAG: T9SS type A sorting domain-containing protein [Bacteroidales bacterium]